MRQSIVRAAQTAVRLQQRTISTSAVRMAAGDTGSPRPGGQQSADAFNKREEAAEAMYIKNQEKQKLLELRQKIKEQQQHLKKLEEHIDEIAANSGGEKN